MAEQNPIYSKYVRARAAVWDREGRILSPHEFLGQIDPEHTRSPESASRYMRKLRSGERSGKIIKQRADDGAGKLYNVAFRNADGDVVDSVNIEVPRGVSLLDIYEDDRILNAADVYMQERHSRSDRERKSAAKKGTDKVIGSEGAYTTKGLSVAGIRRIKQTKMPAAILRPKRKR